MGFVIFPRVELSRPHVEVRETIPISQHAIGTEFSGWGLRRESRDSSAFLHPRTTRKRMCSSVAAPGGSFQTSPCRVASDGFLVDVMFLVRLPPRLAPSCVFIWRAFLSVCVWKGVGREGTGWKGFGSSRVG